MTAEAAYALRLFVVGATPTSQRAIAAIRRICDAELAGCCELEVIDVHQQPELAVRDQIIATPTLVRHRPSPTRWLVGDMSDTARVLTGLDLQPPT